jgi:hypothetical protein
MEAFAGLQRDLERWPRSREILGSPEPCGERILLSPAVETANQFALVASGHASALPPVDAIAIEVERAAVAEFDDAFAVRMTRLRLE